MTGKLKSIKITPQELDDFGNIKKEAKTATCFEVDLDRETAIEWAKDLLDVTGAEAVDIQITPAQLRMERRTAQEPMKV